MANFANWESQLQARANDMLARRIAPLKAEIERLQGAISEIGSRLAEQESVGAGEESSSLIEEIKRWFDDQAAEVEDDFKSRLAAAVAARSEVEVQIDELRDQLEASRRALTISVASSVQSASQAELFDRFTAAIEDVIFQRTQPDILAALVRGAARFAPRVVFFVIKSGAAVGWKASGFENGLNDETVKFLSVPAQNPTLLRDALTGFRLAACEPRSVDYGVSELLGIYSSPTPERAVAIPLIVLNKAVAVLYADTGAQTEGSINTAAAESLTRRAGKMIEQLLSRRGAESARPSALAAAAAAEIPPATPYRTDVKVDSAPQIEKTAETPPPAPDELTIERRPTREIPQAFTRPFQGDEGLREAEAQLPEPAYIETEPGAPPVPRKGADEGVEIVVGVSGSLRFAPAPPPEREQELAIDEAAAAASPAPISDFAVSPVEEPPSPSGDTAFSPPPPPPLFTTPVKPPKSAQSAASVSGSEAERRAQNDARRFARLLVSEIKLFNAAKVNDGRRNYDLYDRLKDEIDSKRKIYDRRVAPAVAASIDFYYEELVQTLAEGDPAKLGKDCPGPVVLA